MTDREICGSHDVLGDVECACKVLTIWRVEGAARQKRAKEEEKR